LSQKERKFLGWRGIAAPPATRYYPEQINDTPQQTSTSDVNDPRVFFAAERTLLAWNRTSLAWMAFGFVIERFGLFMHLVMGHAGAPLRRGESFWLGIAFIVIGALIALLSTLQYRKLLETLKPVEIPEGYRVGVGIFGNLVVALLGLALTIYLFIGEA
jgi:putative membrane protein